MRDDPFFGQYTLKSQEIRKWIGTIMESGNYGEERYDVSLREFPVEYHLLGNNVNHQGEVGKNA
jgi:hypothetical protein